MSTYNKLIEERKELIERLEAINNKIKKIDASIVVWKRPNINYFKK